MRYLSLLTFLVPFLLGYSCATFTSGKIHEMKQIRGIEPGVRIETHIVHDKWRQSSKTFWVSWTDRSIRQGGDHRLNLPKEVWDRYEVGDEIEIVYLPDGEAPYHRDGLYASDGNFVFDYFLFALEILFTAITVLAALMAARNLSRSEADEAQAIEEDVGGVDLEVPSLEDADEAPAFDMPSATDGPDLLEEISAETWEPSQVVDLTELAESPATWFELFGIMSAIFGLYMGLHSLDDPDPTPAVLLCVSGLLGALSLLAARFRSVVFLQVSGIVFALLFLIQLALFIQYGRPEDPPEGDLITILGAAVILGYLMLFPAYSVRSIANRIEGMMYFNQTSEGSLDQVNRVPFGFTALLSILWSPLALLVLISGAGVSALSLHVLIEDGANAKAQIVPFIMLAFVWHLAKRLSPVGNLRQLWRSRSYTLYLRSYADDGARVPGEGSSSGTGALIMPAFEEAIVNALHPHGRVISVSRRWSTPPGAIWAQPFSRDAWREEVVRLIEGASAIALVLGSSEGVLWELRAILSTAARHKTVFLLPPRLGDRFARKVPGNRERLDVFKKEYHEFFATLPQPPWPTETLIGCQIGRRGLRWYTASEPRLSGYALATSYMLAQVVTESLEGPMPGAGSCEQSRTISS